MQDNTRARKVVSDCLCNPKILKKVMENFSNNGLLKLSLVNKLWNYEAKSLMRDRGGLSPSFKLGSLNQSLQRYVQRPMCQDLGAFASDLRRMAVVPFSGMKIQQCDDYTHKCCNPSRTAALNSSYDVVLDRLPWTQFSIDLDRSFEYFHTCPTIQLAKKVMRDYSELFQELSVIILYRQEQFIQEFLQDVSFPSLKILNFGHEGTHRTKGDIELIKAIVSRAPILQELRANMNMKHVAEVLEGSSAVLVPKMFCPFSADAKLSEGSVKLIRLERMALLSFDGDFSPQRFYRIAPVQLQTHRTTLNYLRIHMAYLGPLLSCGISLPNVRKFQIDMNWDLEPSHPVVALLKAFDFTRILPGFTAVDINSYGSEMIPAEAFEQALKEPMPDRAANINHLCVTNYLSAKSASFLAEMVPNIQKLSVKQTQSSRFTQIELIWEHWADLKGLEISIRGQSLSCPFRANFDSFLCGIFPEEVDELRGKDEEFLKSVNIVPVMPSILCFNGLRTLKLLHEQQIVYKQKKDPTAFCSKVAGLIAFARCPNLSVTIQSNLPGLEEALGHMKPYAMVVLERRKRKLLE